LFVSFDSNEATARETSLGAALSGDLWHPLETGPGRRSFGAALPPDALKKEDRCGAILVLAKSSPTVSKRRAARLFS